MEVADSSMTSAILRSAFRSDGSGNFVQAFQSEDKGRGATFNYIPLLYIIYLLRARM